MSTESGLDAYRAEMVRRLTAAMRVADRAFERVGGSTRHHVRDCLMPALEAEGLSVVDAEVVRRAAMVAGLENLARDYAAQRDELAKALKEIAHGLAGPDEDFVQYVDRIARAALAKVKP